MTLTKILLLEDDSAVRDALSQTLMLADLTPVPCASFIVAKDHISPDFQGVVLSDIRMPGRDGFHVLDYVRGIDAELPVILLTGEGDIPMAVRAMEQGAFGFLEKPCAPSELVAQLERALRTRALVLENRALKQVLAAGDPAARMLFGTSAKAEALRDQVRRIAQTGSDSLVTGAPGSGVPKVAEVIHLCSPLARAPFEKRSAAALTAQGVDAALDAAQTGTVFIDEIAALSAEAQFHLLERMEAGAGARIIAGTTAPDAGGQALAPDLYYRLDVGRVRIPSLAERPEDIPVLFRQYVAQAAEQSGTAAPDIPPEKLAQLMAQDWPGNARALMTEAMRFVLGVGNVADKDESLGLAEQMAQVEQSLLTSALKRENGQASAAAQALKLPRKTFYDKLARYGIKPEDFRG